ncbi:S9 family peptidase [Streptomyces sp. NPDC002205]|uniref:S9 family peptidase n=1 Tax=unclassified Streptomyces TaxID=2593676 RepID=UPI003327E2DC
MIPSDISLLPILGRPTLSGDGRFVAVGVTRVDLAADDNVHELWLADTTGEAPARKLTQGPYDGAPAFSPDGRHLAFLRPGPGGPAQLYLLPMDGGEPFPVTNQPLGAGQPVWSPDSQRIAYAARVPQEGRYRRGVPPHKEAPRRITKLRYMADGFGYWFDRPRQVFITDPFTPDRTTTQVTASEHDHGDIAWSPDGDLLTFTAARHETHGDDLRNDVWVCAPDGSGLRALTDGGLTLGCPRFAADGSKVCFAAELLDENNNGIANSSYGLWAATVDGTTPPVRLTDAEPYHLSFSSQMIATATDGVYFANDYRGEVNLILVPYDGGTPTPVITGPRQVNGFAVAEGAHGVTIAAVVADAGSAGDLVVWTNGTERVLTSFGAELQAQGDLLPMEEFTTIAPDGYPLHGWIVRPRGEGPHPVLLQIKGGPFTQWGYTLNGPASFEEAQIYASAGYAVVLGNPRGAAGYGQAHGKAILDDLPRRTATDLLTILEGALNDPGLDGDRVGMLGGSFGGYMSAWMAAHHGKRFRAAIAERGCYSIDSHSASSDEGIVLSLALYGSDPERWRDASPLTYADQIDIPMMLIQSEDDRHTPMEQAQRLFVALKLRGVPVELLLFPGETHEMSRTGLPSHRVARYEAILEWWDRHL